MERFVGIRAFVAYGVWIALFFIIAILTSWYIRPIATWWVWIGCWLIIVGISIPHFIVVVPEVTGLRALNLFTGKIEKPFTPGINFKFPWEIVREKNFFSLETVDKRFEETYASKDGPLMYVKASYQYHPHQDRLDKYLAVDETTIESGFRDVLSSLLSQVISGKDAEVARREIKETEKKVMGMFEEKTIKDSVTGKDISPRNNLENQYGISFQLFIIADIDFSEDYQQMRSAQARMRSFAETTQHLQNTLGGALTAKDAANIMLVEQKKAEKIIYEVEGLDKLEGIGKSLPVIAGVLGKLYEKKGGEKKKRKSKERKKEVKNNATHQS